MNAAIIQGTEQHVTVSALDTETSRVTIQYEGGKVETVRYEWIDPTAETPDSPVVIKLACRFTSPYAPTTRQSKAAKPKTSHKLGLADWQANRGGRASAAFETELKAATKERRAAHAKKMGPTWQRQKEFRLALGQRWNNNPEDFGFKVGS